MVAGPVTVMGCTTGPGRFAGRVASEQVNGVAREPWRPEDAVAGSSTAHPITRRTLLAGLGAGALLALAACAPGGTQDSLAGSGYIAADGSFASWAPDERSEPIALVGTTYGGEELDLADWRGDVAVVNFWYAACPPCRAEAPDLKALHADRGGGRLRAKPWRHRGPRRVFPNAGRGWVRG